MLRIFTIQILALVSSRFNRRYTFHVVKEHLATAELLKLADYVKNKWQRNG